ncbi:MAG: membrane-bound lytic murein transglycosylase MltF [Porticoccaceae bacterium]|nr:membrane-bound lytic murein transglycosylase MltF [Porticoccaceae bacterium]
MMLLSQSRELSRLEAIVANGEITLITRQGPITYYEDAKGKNGFEYLLARDFADYLGVRLDVTTTETLSQLFNMLGGPNGDFAGATLTITPQRLQDYIFSDSYDAVVQTVIYRRGSRAPREIVDLIGKQVAVIADSSHEEHLRDLQRDYPELSWISIQGAEMIELMEMVAAGEIDFAVIDSTTFDAHRSIYPRAARGFDISESQELAWAFPKNGDRSLVNAANRFLQQSRDSGRLAELKTQFFSDIEHFSVAGSLLFVQRLKTRLPEYRPLFERTADRLGIDWHLLAAIAYQESHWNPGAVSPTGVKGMMMLTHDAASEVNVSNRRNVKQSIRGGAEYFLATKARIPADIVEPDRTWFALAAYNVGLGHLEDARVLTDRAGRNPDLWSDVKDFLPLLQRQKYYSTVRHGYARGQEPVGYVRNVIKYRRLLQWNTIEENRRSQRDEKYSPPEIQEWNLDSFKTL